MKKMKKVSNKEIRDIAENIVSKTSKSPSDYDAVEGVDSILREIFHKMEIAVESIKNNAECNCTECKCKK